MIKESDDPIKIMTDYVQSKLFIQNIKRDLQKDVEKAKRLKIQIKYYQLFDDQQLVNISSNHHSCVNNAFKYVLKQKIKYQTLRPFWKVLANIQYNIDQYPNYYQDLLQITNFPEIFVDIIEKDVLRTTQDQKIQMILRNILNAYTIRNSQIGYCQGFNYIAYYLINQQQLNEEETFWFLCHLFETILPANYYNNLYGVQSDDCIIKQLLILLKPQFAKHLSDLQIETSLFTIQWLVCCFTFHNNLSEVIIDLLLIDGSKALIISVLTYINLMENNLLQTQDIGQFILTLENFISQFNNREQFITEYDKIYLNNKILQNVRQDYSKNVVSMIQEKNSQNASSIDYFLNDLKKKTCNLKYPVCEYIFRAWHRNKKHFDFNILKVENIQIIHEYEQIKLRRSILDNDGLLMCRQNHICQSDDFELIKEIQHQDKYNVELIDVKKIQPQMKKSNNRARSPIKDILLFPLKAFNQKEQENKLQMNPQKYKIEVRQNYRTATSYQPQCSPKKQRSNTNKNFEQRRSYQPQIKEMNNSQQLQTFNSQPQEEFTTIRESISINFLSELSKNTDLINVQFDYKQL